MVLIFSDVDAFGCLFEQGIRRFQIRFRHFVSPSKLPPNIAD
jgi:hypothetical protein